MKTVVTQFGTSCSMESVGGRGARRGAASRPLTAGMSSSFYLSGGPAAPAPRRVGSDSAERTLPGEVVALAPARGACPWQTPSQLVAWPEPGRLVATCDCSWNGCQRGPAHHLCGQSLDSLSPHPQLNQEQFFSKEGLLELGRALGTPLPTQQVSLLSPAVAWCGLSAALRPTGHLPLGGSSVPDCPQATVTLLIVPSLEGQEI